MGAMASQITSLMIVYSTVYSSADQRKHLSSASLAFVRRIHRWPVYSPHKVLVTRKVFPFDDVIIPGLLCWHCDNRITCWCGLRHRHYRRHHRHRRRRYKNTGVDSRLKRYTFTSYCQCVGLLPTNSVDTTSAHMWSAPFSTLRPRQRDFILQTTLSNEFHGIVFQSVHLRISFAWQILSAPCNADWCYWLCLLRISEVWSLYAGTLIDELTLSPPVILNQDHVTTHDIFCFSPQTWDIGIIPWNCM